MEQARGRVGSFGRVAGEDRPFTFLAHAKPVGLVVLCSSIASAGIITNS
jgi:hypothetical protein